MTLGHGDKEYRTAYATRVATGIYYSHLIEDALSYSPWYCNFPFDTDRADWKRLGEMPDGPDREALRTAVLRRPNDYGIADDLAAVLRYGRAFVRSPHPHVLAYHVLDRIDEKWYKNGSYVRNGGRPCPEPGAVSFHFYRLTPRQPGDPP